MEPRAFAESPTTTAMSRGFSPAVSTLNGQTLRFPLWKPGRLSRSGAAAGMRRAADDIAQLALIEWTGGSREAAVNHVAPASPEPKTSPEVAPK
jgi:hypothetical protein